MLKGRSIHIHGPARNVKAKMKVKQINILLRKAFYRFFCSHCNHKLPRRQVFLTKEKSIQRDKKLGKLENVVRSFFRLITTMVEIRICWILMRLNALHWIVNVLQRWTDVKYLKKKELKSKGYMWRNIKMMFQLIIKWFTTFSPSILYIYITENWHECWQREKINASYFFCFLTVTSWWV